MALEESAHFSRSWFLLRLGRSCLSLRPRSPSFRATLHMGAKAVLMFRVDLHPELRHLQVREFP